MTRTLVLGVGNLLMGDEGAGVHALRLLEQEPDPIAADVVDGGTGGFHLLAYFEKYNPIVLIDATMDGRPPGTVSLLRPRFSSDFPRVLSAHDIGLRDLVESAALLRPLPEMYLITISVDSIQPMEVRLSPPVEAALPRAAAMARDIVKGQSAHSGIA